MPLDPVSLAAILQQLQQQGGGGQSPPPGGMIPPGQVSPQPPMPGQAQGMPPPQAAANPLMQMAQKAMSNPQAQTIPQPPAAPSTSSAHPVLAQIMQALSSGMQNFGYGMQTGPQQLQRQALDAQKSEAMARLGMEQAQLAETQRYHTGELGIRGQQAQTEAKGQAATERYQTGELEQAGKRTAIDSARQQQEAKYQSAEIAAKQQALDLQHKQLDEETRSHKAEERLGGARIGVEQTANQLHQQQLDLDKQKIQQTFQIQGLQFNRETLEAERKNRIDAVESHYKEHPWWTMRYGLEGKQKDIDAVNQDIDAREGKAAGAAGVPNFSGGPQQGGGGQVQHVPGGPAQGLTEGATGTGSDSKPYVVKGGKWVPRQSP